MKDKASMEVSFLAFNGEFAIFKLYFVVQIVLTYTF